MKRIAAARVLAVLLAAPALFAAQRAPAQVAPVPAPVHPAAVSIPIVLPIAPPPLGGTSSTLFAARLAIARAQQIDPQAAQTAAFAYVKAVQQYRSGNISGANISALQALSAASQAQVQVSAPAQLPTPAFVPAVPQTPGLAGGLYGGDSAAIDADSFIALACAPSRRRRFHYGRYFRTFAGTPPAIAKAGTECATTPAAITAPSPIVTPGSTTTFAPSQTPRPMRTSDSIQG
jgi:hypothetical protein